MLLLLHSIYGLVTQKIDKKVQMYAYESNRHRHNLFLPYFLHKIGLQGQWRILFQ